MRDYLKFFIGGTWVEPAQPKTLNPGQKGRLAAQQPWEERKGGRRTHHARLVHWQQSRVQERHYGTDPEMPN